MDSIYIQLIFRTRGKLVECEFRSNNPTRTSLFNFSRSQASTNRHLSCAPTYRLLS